MRKVIIACYYGRFPAWMNLWVKSCELNPDFDFLLVTDSELQNLPPNMTLHQESIADLKRRFCRVLGFEVCLEQPYKLCDYKPVYGLAFQELIKDYDFWGHCDIDLVFGRIGHFFTDELFEQYDRLGTYAHLLFYRNNDEMNHLFMKKGSIFNYQTVFKGRWYYGLDEMFGMSLICRRNHMNWYDCGHTYCLDKSKKHLGNPLVFSGLSHDGLQGVLWEDGRIYQVYWSVDGQLKKEEKMYFHFSKNHYEPISYTERLVFDAERIMPVTSEETLLAFLQSSSESHDHSLKAPSLWKRLAEADWQQRYIYLKRFIGLQWAKMMICR